MMIPDRPPPDEAAWEELRQAVLRRLEHRSDETEAAVQRAMALYLFQFGPATPPPPPGRAH